MCVLDATEKFLYRKKELTVTEKSLKTLKGWKALTIFFVFNSWDFSCRQKDSAGF